MKKFLKGMHKDAERVDMIDGTYRDALNANLYITKGAIVNEHGTVPIGTHTSPNFTIQNIIGQCSLEDGRIVLFAIDENPGTEGTHVISLIDPKQDTYRVLYRNDDLNYKTSYTIEAISKVDSRGQIKVYFTDNYISRVTDNATGIDYIDEYNPPRVFDVTKQLEHIESSSNPLSQIILYGNNQFTIDKLDIFMHSGSIPEFTTVDIVEGGGVVSGTYHLALAYMDDDRNTTNYLVTSNAVHIVTAPENALPTESITGDPQGSQSNKSIKWEFTVPIENRNYTHIHPIVIQRFGGGQNQASSEFAYALDPVRLISGASQAITYTGLETVAQSSVKEVVIDSIRYESAKTFVQLDNRLYLSNLQSRGDIGFQRFANKISLTAVTEEIERFDPRHFDVININKGYSTLRSLYNTPRFTLIDTIADIYQPIQGNESTTGGPLSDDQLSKFSGNVRKGYKDVSLSYKKKSYRRSEVYAFYISFVLKDGTESYAYHIPGRTAQEIGEAGFFENEAFSDHTPSDFQDNVGLDTSELVEQYASGRLHQFSDTQVIIWEQNGVNISTNYWENDDEVYPTTDNYTVWETDSNGVPIQTGDIKGDKVRHHKMPSNKHVSYSFIRENKAENTPNNTESMFEPNLYGDPNDNQDLELKEDIRILGIKLDDIHIPKFILKQVQGYKIYYAKRRQKDKTILGQSVPVPAAMRANTVIGMNTSIAKYGPYNRAWWMSGIIPTNPKGDYPYIQSKLGPAKYFGFPVFKFHDFNMLKNHNTLSGASHVDIQSILIFRAYRGGPGGTPRPVSGQPTTTYFTGSDWGPNTEIGNTSFPSKVSSDSEVPEKAAATIKAFVTSVCLAAGYISPKSAAEEVNSQFGLYGWASNYLSNVQTLYTIQAKSTTYLPGHTFLESTDSGAYHGAKHLLNFGGESAIAVGLSTGLPMLTGYVNNSYDPIEGNRFAWYPLGGYLNAAASGLGSQNLNWVLNLNKSANLEPDGDTENNFVGGFPTGYLLNLCSAKENIYDSFDEQQLVWTGHYQSLKDVDIETGEDSETGTNYFEGAASDNIFGGDTYISRYGFRSTGLSYGFHYYKGKFDSILSEGLLYNFYHADIPFDLNTGMTGLESVWIPDTTLGGSTDTFYADDIDYNLGVGDLDDDGNLASPSHDLKSMWAIGNNTPYATVFYFFCETDDLIGYRHSADNEEGVLEEDGRFFDGSTGNSILFNSPTHDYTHMDNLLYMNNYSLNQDIRVTIPLPKKIDDITLYPTRTIRSNIDEGAINDKYREYLALEYKDIPKNRGDIWKLFTLRSILYIHTEKSLFVTKGKENLQMGGETQAFIGSGDIFAQDPDELISTNEGYGGTDAQFASITTRYGHFYVNRKARKVLLFAAQIEEVSSAGMEKWFLDNLGYTLEDDYNLDLETYAASENVLTDAPTGFFGFTAAYDAKFKRILLTKRELKPTILYTSLYNNGDIIIVNGQAVYDDNYSSSNQIIYGKLELSNTNFFTETGWTVSYYPELKIWGSRHSYLPRLYSYNIDNYFSLVNSANTSTNQIWEHSDETNPGKYYGTVYNFEFEYIDNTKPGASKIFSAVTYWTEIQSKDTVNIGEIIKHTSPAFTSFYVYNTKQISGTEDDINYLTNARLVDKFWYINDFRDKSNITTLTGAELVTGVANVQENFTTGVDAATETVPMFTSEGNINPLYIDSNKQWYDQRRFVDHYLGVRLICNNSTGNLVHLYAAGTKHRKSFR